MLRSVLAHVSLAIVALVAFTATAYAAGATGADDGALLDVLRPVIEAVLSGNYLAASALALVAAVALARRYAPASWRLRTDAGGALLVLIGSFGGALGAAALGGATLSLALLWKALTVAAGAAGGYSMVKRLIVPLIERLPGWAQTPLKLIMWIFDRRAPVAEAEQAGAAAVAAKPSTGAAGVVGQPRNVK